MSTTQTVTAQASLSDQHDMSTLSPPSQPHHGRAFSGFFKRHLGSHRRQRTSTTEAEDENAASDSVSQTSRNNSVVSQAEKHVSPLPPIPRIAVRQPTTPLGGTVERGRTLSSEAHHSTEAGLSTSSTRGSRGAVRFVSGQEDDRDESQRQRPSIPTVRSRRSSIYAKTEEGYYGVGVDAGVGSKARRLSVQIPDSFVVDECKLEDYFGPMARMRRKQVGEGGAATVQVMPSKKVGGKMTKDRVYAVKEFRVWEPDEEPESEYDRKIRSEYAVARSCDHPNIVETYLLCYSQNHTSWHHVMEYCEVGDLNDTINRGYFSREDRTCVFKQLLRGVDYLHSRGIAHRDLKSENLLLTSTGCLKIADFGTSEVFSGKHPGQRKCRRPSIIPADAEIRLCKPGLVGSRPYMAPEIIRREQAYDPRAVDVWSCGVVLLTLILGGTPWSEASTEVKNFNIYCASWDQWLEYYPDGRVLEDRGLPNFVKTKEFQKLGDPGTKRLAFGLLHPDPSKRWTVHEALECTTVKDYPCCQQDGYSDDIRTRQKKALHNHLPPKKPRALGGLSGAQQR